MKISHNWLLDYVDAPSADRVAEVCNLRGMEVESVSRIGFEFAGVVTAHVRGVESLAGSDHLTVCQVFDGAATHRVICGAPNVRAGIVVAWAKPGSSLPGIGLVSEKDVRGVRSAGMLVSKRELGISEDHAGIWILPENTPIGAMLEDAVPVRDTVIEVDITANRPDLLSVIGMAREIAAALGVPLRRPDVPAQTVGGDVTQRMSVRIESPELCPRYTGSWVEGLRVAPSPLWMQLRLEAVGVRAISNLVDITNYVLHECGQPLHAFDPRFLDGAKIIVRAAREGETITTLDEIERKLVSTDLLICDGTKPVALAGVMGGANSLVSDSTSDVFIESAYFQPVAIRKTSQRLGLSTDSSYRFERGVDIDGVPWGLARAASLMAELGQGRIVTGMIDEYPAKREPLCVRARASRVNWILGTELTQDRVRELLGSIGILAQPLDGDALEARVPAFRVDLTREIDLIEEVGRLHGFGGIPYTMPATNAASKPMSKIDRIQQRCRETLVGLGYNEVVGISMTSAAVLDKVRREPGTYVEIRNPLTSEMSVLRDTLLPNLFRALRFNLARQEANVAIFETRRVFRPVAGEKFPLESLFVAGLITGARYPQTWAHTQTPVDFFDAKGAAEELLSELGLGASAAYGPGDDDPVLTYGAAARIEVNGRRVGRLGRFNDDVLAAFDIDVPAFGFEIDLSALSADALPKPYFQPWSRFPRTGRDIAVTVERTTPVGPMVEALRAVDPTNISAVSVFDVYTGQGVAASEKSIAFSVEIQSLSRTLTADDTNRLFESCLAVLTERFGAKLRN
ncbi:MAG: phenylalanine--tRNA ligase subunit beta [Deltaproteobacteria bacterium]|nr:phenylalanine--tRNA ligase subunit beta [Deltaproteobacteria bacterium]